MFFFCCLFCFECCFFFLNGRLVAIFSPLLISFFLSFLLVMFSFSLNIAGPGVFIFFWCGYDMLVYW
jgi:hypothetical protein